MGPSPQKRQVQTDQALKDGPKIGQQLEEPDRPENVAMVRVSDILLTSMPAQVLSHQGLFDPCFPTQKGKSCEPDCDLQHQISFFET